eukprot:TRINITY_DN10975_c0_g1_i1.p2 TRINITY_DN10975_c0_g1~~TRINITY_DN10975_c0_g1_i1.p2  ORF type:complete len:355 (-),score=61.77 TRINITY_DN10975_c0_g1_i1:67-1131(-)
MILSIYSRRKLRSSAKFSKRQAACVSRAGLSVLSVRCVATTKNNTINTKEMSLISKYMSISKARLGALVAMTTFGGYLVAPVPFDPIICAVTTIGTVFTIASANSLNQYIEIEHDTKMNRTKGRMLPTKQLSPLHVLTFGVCTGILGTVILYTGTNIMAASLAAGNILLYALVYTPLKRYHWLNTWVGSIVGAIPPLIGWAAATGGLDYGAGVLFYILFYWQISHFLALSYSLRGDYGKAGYKMLVNHDTDKVGRLILRYSIYMLAIGPMAYLAGMVDMSFVATASLLTSGVVYQSYKFRYSSDDKNKNSKKLFKYGLSYLPLLFILLFIHKNILEYVSDKNQQEAEESALQVE